MDKVILVAVDHGFSTIKTPDDVFATAISEIDEPITQEKTLYIGGKYYRTGGRRIDVLEDKTSTESFRNLTYVAIAKMLERMNRKSAHVILAVGLPIGRMAKEKEAFKKYLMSPAEVKFRYSGKAYKVTIEKVFVYPQCYGAVVDRLPGMKSEEVIVDIGSWTVDTLCIVDRSPDESRCGSDPNGLIPCMRHIDEECVKRFNSKVGENLIREVMIGGTADLDEGYLDVINKELKAYTKSVFHILREQGVNVRTTPITFVGGGAALMRRYGELDQKNIRYIEDIRANAKGYEKLLKAYLDSTGVAYEG